MDMLDLAVTLEDDLAAAIAKGQIMDQAIADLEGLGEFPAALLQTLRADEVKAAVRVEELRTDVLRTRQASLMTMLFS